MLYYYLVFNRNYQYIIKKKIIYNFIIQVYIINVSHVMQKEKEKEKKKKKKSIIIASAISFISCDARYRRHKTIPPYQP